MRVLLALGLLGLSLSSGAALACWACDAGPGEECYLEESWDSEAELAKMGGQACRDGDDANQEVMAASTGGAWTHACVNGKISVEQLSAKLTMKVRKAKGSPMEIVRVPRPTASKLPGEGSADDAIGAKGAVATCTTAPASEACRTAHAEMLAKAEGLVLR